MSSTWRAKEIGVFQVQLIVLRKCLQKSRVVGGERIHPRLIPRGVKKQGSTNHNFRKFFKCCRKESGGTRPRMDALSTALPQPVASLQPPLYLAAHLAVLWAVGLNGLLTIFCSEGVAKLIATLKVSIVRSEIIDIIDRHIPIIIHKKLYFLSRA